MTVEIQMQSTDNHNQEINKNEKNQYAGIYSETLLFHDGWMLSGHGR